MSNVNGVMLQFFQWHTKDDGTLWKELAKKAPELVGKGFTSIWIPPCCKGNAGGMDVGYGVYDLFDLGEFDQKGSVRTKYGSKEDLLFAIKICQHLGLQIYADTVLNHKCGADKTEEVTLRVVNESDRNEVYGEPFKGKVWSIFEFPGRDNKHSAFKWNAQHFKCFDHKEEDNRDGELYILADKTFSGEVSFEKGNYDYLMGADIDHYHRDVREELFYWGRWFIEATGVDGLRMDAVKHYPSSFVKDFLHSLRSHNPHREIFSVAEYWSSNVSDLARYIDDTEGKVALYDVPLHMSLSHASKSGNNYDMRQIFDGSLTAVKPTYAITFVDNHDTQPGQSLESWVDDWFKPIAYALILLRRDGYPCVFYPDYYGADCEGLKYKGHEGFIDALIRARQSHGFGEQHDYFDHPNCIGWKRTGDEKHPGAMIVILSNGDRGFKTIGGLRPNARFDDITLGIKDHVTTNEKGETIFACPPGSVSVWVERI